MLTLTKDEAINKLMYSKHEQLVSLINSASKLMLLTPPRNIDTLPVVDLVSWWLVHFEFDEGTQKWCFVELTTPTYEEAAEEVEYYNTFG